MAEISGTMQFTIITGFAVAGYALYSSLTAIIFRHTFRIFKAYVLISLHWPFDAWFLTYSFCLHIIGLTCYEHSPRSQPSRWPVYNGTYSTFLWNPMLARLLASIFEHQIEMDTSTTRLARHHSNSLLSVLYQTFHRSVIFQTLFFSFSLQVIIFSS